MEALQNEADRRKGMRRQCTWQCVERFMIPMEHCFCTNRQHFKENPVMKYFDRGSFEVIVRLNACIKRKRVLGGQIIDLNWYADFVELTLLLYGMGRRSRKGRGRVSVTGREYDSESQALHWLCTAFNRFLLFRLGKEVNHIKL